MNRLEWASAAIVALLFVALWKARGWSWRFVLEAVVVAAAGWISEESSIRWYGGYHYTAGRWSLWFADVPVMVVVIWPMVVLSAYSLVEAVRCSGAARMARAWLVASLVVLADASLIEPVSVASGLWRWHEPGPFQVPLVGLFGWWVFAAGVLWWLSVVRERGWNHAWFLAALVVAPAMVHVAIVISWWGLFRWIGSGLPAAGLIALVWVGASSMGLRLWSRRCTVPLVSVFVRAPAAGFFFVLLVPLAPSHSELVVYALAFSVPYLVIIGRSFFLSKERTC